MADHEIKTQCCIAGGGPAGIMLGFLLARAGVDVVVLEKWPDFFRDFRGDTIHPSTMDVLYELGLLDEFLKLKHNETREFDGYVSGKRIVMANFSHLPTRCKFIAFIPQWDFLNFIAAHARTLPSFHLMMATEATDLLQTDGAGKNGSAVAGLHAKAASGDTYTIHADLVVGADGRHSTIRDAAGLKSQAFGVPMDVLWFRISRRESDAPTTFGSVDDGKMLVFIDRDEYWQCAAIIKKGAYEKTRAAGLDAFRARITELSGFEPERMQEIKTWDDVKFLNVAIDRLDTWYKPGLLCIGDSAHAMSPIGGIGINLAIQDAVAAANLLIPIFARGATPSMTELASFQARREPPTRKTQELQIFIQDHLIGKVLDGGADATGAATQTHYGIPWQIRLMQRLPILRRIPARIIGMGFLPEHIEH